MAREKEGEGRRAETHASASGAETLPIAIATQTAI